MLLVHVNTFLHELFFLNFLDLFRRSAIRHLLRYLVEKFILTLDLMT